MTATRIPDLIASLEALRSEYGDAPVTVVDPYDGHRYPAVLVVERDEFDRFESICVRPGVGAGISEDTTETGDPQ